MSQASEATRFSTDRQPVRRTVSGPVPGPIRPYASGWRAPWAGSWGPLSDGNSSLGKPARRIRKELLAEYDGTEPLAARRIRQAAQMMALSEMTMAMIGRDPKATRRAAWALSKGADNLLARLTANGNKRSTSTTLHDILAEDAKKPRS